MRTRSSSSRPSRVRSIAVAAFLAAGASSLGCADTDTPPVIVGGAGGERGGSNGGGGQGGGGQASSGGAAQGGAGGEAGKGEGGDGGTGGGGGNANTGGSGGNGGSANTGGSGGNANTGGSGGNANAGGAGGGADEPTCDRLVIADPKHSAYGYVLYRPEQKQNQQGAGRPEYVFLKAAAEAVALDGPDVVLPSGALTLDQPSIAVVNAQDTYADGYTVRASAHLRYDVEIRDFEYEVALSQVELCQTEQTLHSRFIFRANPTGDGVAHDITIKATADGTAFGPALPWTVEVR